MTHVEVAQAIGIPCSGSSTWQPVSTWPPRLMRTRPATKWGTNCVTPAEVLCTIWCLCLIPTIWPRYSNWIRRLWPVARPLWYPKILTCVWDTCVLALGSTPRLFQSTKMKKNPSCSRYYKASSFLFFAVYRSYILQLHYTPHTGAKIHISSKKNHKLKISFFTKFSISKPHFSQNSRFQSLIFHIIHIFQTSNSW